MTPGAIFPFLLLLYCVTPPWSAAQWMQTGFSASAEVRALAISGTILWAGTDGKGILRSSDNGASWYYANSNIPTGAQTTSAFLVSGTRVYAGTGRGLYLTTDNGKSWRETDVDTVPGPIYALAAAGNEIFAGSYQGRVFRTADQGITWMSVGIPGSRAGVASLAFMGSTLFAGTWVGVFRSSDDGTTWTAVSNGLGSLTAEHLIVSGGKLFAGTYDSGVYISSDSGNVWAPVNTGLPAGFIRSLAASGSNLFVSVSGWIYHSSDNGAHWEDAGFPPQNAGCLAILGTDLFVGTGSWQIWRRPLADFTTSVKTIPRFLPERFALDQNYPNPFNPATTIRYSLPHDAHVTLAILNTLGQEVALLVNADIEAGCHEVLFNAGDIASGVYFYRLSATPVALSDRAAGAALSGHAGNFVDVKQLVVLK